MPLKKASGKVEVFHIDGSEVHAVRPNKAAWDEYSDQLFDRDKNGELQVKSGRAISTLYRQCVRKLANVEVGVDEKGEVILGGITNPDEIVAFLKGLENAEAGRQIDAWLLGMAELSKGEAKN